MSRSGRTLRPRTRRPWRVHLLLPAPPASDEVLEAAAGPPTPPPLAALKQSRVLSCEVLLAAVSTTTASATAPPTAPSTTVRESRVLFIEALSGPTTSAPAGYIAPLASPPPSRPAIPDAKDLAVPVLSEELAAGVDSGLNAPGPDGFTALLAPLHWALYEPYWSPGASDATLASGPALSGALCFQAEPGEVEVALPSRSRGRTERARRQRARHALASAPTATSSTTDVPYLHPDAADLFRRL